MEFAKAQLNKIFCSGGERRKNFRVTPLGFLSADSSLRFVVLKFGA
jgi:hypothetical protein